MFRSFGSEYLGVWEVGVVAGVEWSCDELIVELVARSRWRSSLLEV